MKLVQLCCVLLLTLSVFSVRGEGVKKSNVLVLHSYNQGFIWSDSVTKGISSVFEPYCDSIELYYDYLDTKRHPVSDYSDKVHHLECCENGVVFDAVIAVDNNALSFLQSYSSELFPGVPIAFCGVNNFTPSLIDGLSRVTGVIEDPAYRETLELMVQLHPDTSNVVVLVDQTPTGDTVYEQVVSIADSFKGRLKFEFCRDLALDELAVKVSQMGDDSMILLLNYNQDQYRNFISYRELGKTIRENSRVPAYSSWGFNLGECIVGGKIISGEGQGAEVARQVLRIIGGEDVKHIPIKAHDNAAYIFDWVEMEKFGIGFSELPADATVINPPLSFVQKYQALFMTLLIISGGLVVILSFRNIHYRYKQHLLVETNKNLDTAVSVKTQELTELLLQFKSIFNTSVIGIAEVETSGLIRRVNARFRDIIRCSCQKIVGCSIFDVEGGQDFEEVFDYLAQCDDVDSSLYQSEISVKRDGGCEIWYSVSAQLFQAEAGLQRVVLVIDDITKRKRLESLKDDVARIVQHDLKGSLVGIISLPQFLASTGEWSEKQLDILKTIESSGQRMLEMINNSLTVYKIETGTYTFDPKPLDVEKLIQEIFTGFGSMAKNKGVEFKMTSSGESYPLLADRLLCHTLFENLIKNAFEASPVGCHVRVSIIYGDRAVVNVANCGAVPHEIRDEFFEKYISCNKNGGTGLGTYSARLFAEAMDGAIELDANDEKTSVSVFLKPYVV